MKYRKDNNILQTPLKKFLYSQTKWQTPDPIPRFYRWETEVGSRFTLEGRDWVPEDKFKGHLEM